MNAKINKEALQSPAMVKHQSPRIRNSRGLMLVCIAGALGAWNFLLSMPSTTNHSPPTVENHQAQRQETSLKAGAELSLVKDNVPNTSLSIPHANVSESVRPSSIETRNDTTTSFQFDKNDIQAGFPVTRFTPHVMEVVNRYHFDKIHECEVLFHFVVPSENGAHPTVECETTSARGNNIRTWWCRVLRQDVFLPRKQRTLPFNVSFAVSIQDYLWHRDRHACIGNSNNGGNFSITNFLEIQRMANRRHYRSLPWENRSSIPIFRGTPWIREVAYRKIDRSASNESSIYNQVLRMSPRLMAVDYSLRNPSLLNARTGHRGPNVDTKNDTIWMENSTMGLYKLLENDKIAVENYYKKNQVAVVLCGIGAAFRTTIHMETTTTVVLQDCDKLEWFTNLMTPFEHYIPLQKDLGDLDERMKWIQSHPNQVRDIAEKGHTFYNDYLSFERNEEHIYELVYRLALAKHQLDTQSNDTSTTVSSAEGPVGKATSGGVRISATLARVRSMKGALASS